VSNFKLLISIVLSFLGFFFQVTLTEAEKGKVVAIVIAKSNEVMLAVATRESELNLLLMIGGSRRVCERRVMLPSTIMITSARITEDLKVLDLENGCCSTGVMS